MERNKNNYKGNNMVGELKESSLTQPGVEAYFIQGEGPDPKLCTESAPEEGDSYIWVTDGTNSMRVCEGTFPNAPNLFRRFFFSKFDRPWSDEYYNYGSAVSDMALLGQQEIPEVVLWKLSQRLAQNWKLFSPSEQEKITEFAVRQAARLPTSFAVVGPLAHLVSDVAIVDHLLNAGQNRTRENQCPEGMDRNFADNDYDYVDQLEWQVAQLRDVVDLSDRFKRAYDATETTDDRLALMWIRAKYGMSIQADEMAQLLDRALNISELVDFGLDERLRRLSRLVGMDGFAARYPLNEVQRDAIFNVVAKIARVRFVNFDIRPLIKLDRYRTIKYFSTSIKSNNEKIQACLMEKGPFSADEKIVLFDRLEGIQFRSGDAGKVADILMLALVADFSFGQKLAQGLEEGYAKYFYKEYIEPKLFSALFNDSPLPPAVRKWLKQQLVTHVAE